MKKTLFLFFIFFFNFSIANTQSSNLDSINISTLLTKAQDKFYYYNDSGFIYIDSAINKSILLNNKALLALSYKTKGTGYYFFEQNDSALNYYKQAYNFYNEINDTPGIANCYNNIAIVQFVKGEFQGAIDWNFKALKLREQMNYIPDIIMSYINIANAFGEIGENRTAIEYNKKALKYAISTNDTSKMATIYNNLGADFGMFNLTDSAILYYEQALPLYIKLNKQKGIAISYVNLGNNYGKKNEIKKSINYFEKAINIAYELENNEIIIGAELGKANLLIKLEEYKPAEVSLNKALKLALEYNYIVSLRDIYQNFSELYTKQHNHAKALHYYKQYTILKDSIVNTDNTMYVTELETKYQTEKKDRKIESLVKDNEIQIQQVKAQRRLIVLIALVSFFVLLLWFLYYRWKQIKQRSLQNELELINLRNEQKMLRSQMNPHFIYNSLNSIQSFISSDDSYQAEKYLARFAKLMRGILENSRADFIPLEKEIEVLNLYMELEQLRFENKFSFQIIEDEDMESEFLSIPPMLVQPFIENAILHGFANRNNGNITVTFKETDHFVCCTIDDNGIGRTEAAKNKKANEHNSLATKITQERLDTLNQQLNLSASFKIIDKTSEQTDKTPGTKVIIDIPFKEL